MQKKKLAVYLAVFAAVVTVSKAEEPAKKSLWSTSLAIGANLSTGNSESKAATASLITEMSTVTYDARIGLEGNYGKAKVKKEVNGVQEEIDDTTAQNAKAFGNAKRKFDRNYIFTDDTILYDERAGIDSRVVLSTGVGRFLVDNKQTRLCADVGAAYIREDLSTESDVNNSLAYRLSGRLEQKLSDTAKLWGAAEYLPIAEDLGSYLFNGELGTEAALNTRLSLRIVAQDRYNSEPPTNRKSNDLLTTASIVYKF